MRKPVTVPGWLLISMGVVVGANLVAGTATGVTIDLMQSPSAFARAVRLHDETLLMRWRCIAYPTLIAVSLAYLWPLIAHFRCGASEVPPPRVQRRAINGPLVTAAIGFSGWVSSVLVFPAITIAHFGEWRAELMSQHVLSPLVNGFLAATTSYLVVDWVFRTRVIPHVFPDGRLTDVAGAGALGVTARLVVFLVAVAFIPLFTMFGLVRATAARLQEPGADVTAIVTALIGASEGTFLLYVALGLVLTMLLARTFTRPLGEVAAALRRVRAGSLDQLVRVTSTDEIGVLEEGVNAMAATLRDRERILQTFGRVVEPVIRDRLLAGDLRAEGEVRTASVLFCDLRGFTAFAERTAPRELVQTLNQFFTSMTAWARECDGFVDKFVGDGILVVFGLFHDDARGPATGAAGALRCALGMHERLAVLNRERVALGLEPLAMKIGVHTGPVVAGTLGAADRHEYTVVGDTVNVAARLEELCREHGCEVIVSTATWELARAGGAVLPDGVAAAVTPRGRDEPVRVYRIGAARPETSSRVVRDASMKR